MIIFVQNKHQGEGKKGQQTVRRKGGRKGPLTSNRKKKSNSIRENKEEEAEATLEGANVNKTSRRKGEGKKREALHTQGRGKNFSSA